MGKKIALIGHLLKRWFVFAAIFGIACASSHAGESWPQFRGPNGDGISDAKNLPVTFSETDNLRWKTLIHDKGLSSPVVLNNQIWLTTATADGKVVTNGGRVLAVTALGNTIPTAKLSAYTAVKQIRWEGAWCRKDISDKAQRYSHE